MGGARLFGAAFPALTGHEPFCWQARLFERFVRGDLPDVCDIPTGLGKTSVMAIWLIALAEQAKTAAPTLPRRLVYVVDRRTVVDQATDVAERIREGLSAEKATGLSAALAELSGDRQKILTISTLRGEFADNGEWRQDPARAAIIIGTVDMIGSRLLFSGYGVSRKMRAFHAGLIGQDALILHDEAHLSPAFGALIGKVAAIQRDCREPRPLRVMDLSATQRVTADGSVFRLTPEETAEERVAARLRARKRLRFLSPDPEKASDQRLAEAALRHKEAQARVLVYVQRPKDAVAVANRIRADVGTDAVAALTGTIRGYERDRLTADPEQLEDEGARKRARLFRSFRAGPDREPPEKSLFLVATSAGEVGVDLDADHMVCDLTTLDSMIQRLGRVNRLGRKDENFVAEIDVIEALPDKTKGDDSGGAADRHKRAAATRKILQPADGAESRDVSPQALRALLEGLSEDERKAAFSETPTILELTDVLLDGWAMTSVQNLPGRPLVERWLHGVTSEPPSTYVAWREEVEHVADLEAPADGLRRLFEVHPILAREKLRGNRGDVVDELKKIAKRIGEQRPVILVPPRGDPSSVPLGELLKKDSEERLREATIVLPADAGGLDDSGMLDGSKDRQDLDVADKPSTSASRDGGMPAGPQRARVLLTYDSEGESWAARLLGTGNTLEGGADGFRKTARSIRDKPELADMRETARIVLEKDTDGAEIKALLLFARRGTIEAAEGSQESARGEPVKLSKHNRDVGKQAKSVAARLHLPPDLAPFGAAAVLAAERHDLGKDRPGWQKAIGNSPKPDGWKAWAKSGRSGFDNSACGEYRHELGSLRETLSHSEIRALGEIERELALHLIAAHHGWARPHFDERHWDIAEGVGDEENAGLSAETMRRYARLQRRFGRWGLAWLESLLRAADHRVSARGEPDEASDSAEGPPSKPKAAA